MRSLVVVCIALIGCGGSTPADVKTPEHGTDPAAAPAGGGDKAKYDEAAALVHPLQPWAEAEVALKGKLGEPTKAEGDTVVWQSGEGAACHALTVTKMGDSVGGAVVAPCS